MDRNEIITVAALLAFALLLLGVWIVDRRRRHAGDTRSPLSGVLGMMDEVFRPETARVVEVREVEQELPVEASNSGDLRSDSLSGPTCDSSGDSAACSGRNSGERVHDSPLK